MDLGLQAKLLRVLQEREVERLGSLKTTSLDVRVIATTNKKLRAEVDAGRFRGDLFYRLNVFPLLWTPLNKRKQDIVPLAEYFIERNGSNSTSVAPKLSAATKKILLAYKWPGNAREMDNIMQRALILHTGDTIEVSDIKFTAQDMIKACKKTNSLAIEKPGVISKEYKRILNALQLGKGNKKVVAKNLGITSRTLSSKLAQMKEQGITVG